MAKTAVEMLAEGRKKNSSTTNLSATQMLAQNSSADKINSFNASLSHTGTSSAYKTVGNITPPNFGTDLSLAATPSIYSNRNRLQNTNDGNYASSRLGNSTGSFAPEEPSFLDRIGNVAGAAGTGTAASFVNAAGSIGEIYNKISPIGKIDQLMQSLPELAQTALDSRREEITDNDYYDFLDRMNMYGDIWENASPANTVQGFYDTADSLQQTSTGMQEKAKQDGGFWGGLAVDVGVGGLQLAGDIAAGALTGGSALAPLAVRSFGGATQQARQEGAELGEQLAYAVPRAATSVLIERISNLAPSMAKAFGPGLLDNVVAKAVGDIGQTAIGKVALSALGEGTEEFLEAAIDPVLKNISYTDGETFDLADGLYQALVGGVIGGVVGGGNVITQRPTQNESSVGTPEILQTADPFAITENPTSTTEIPAPITETPTQITETTTPITEVRQQRSSEEITSDMQRLPTTAATLGEIGSRAFSSVYTEGEASTLPLADAYSGFAMAYNAEISGRDLTSEQQAEVDALPSHIIAAAKAAGDNEAVRVSQAQYFGENAGLVRDDTFKKARLTSKNALQLDALAKATGTQIQFVDNITAPNGAEANARYQDGVMQISLQSSDPAMTAAIHESVHRIRETAPEVYTAMTNFVQDALQGETITLKGYDHGNTDVLTEEVVAHAFGYVLGDSNVLNRFVTDNRNAAQKFADVLRDIITKIGNALTGKNVRLSKEQRAQFKALETRMIATERVFTDALTATQKQTKNTDTPDGDGEARYSVQQDSEGNALSEAQVEFFKDSKVRDDEGKLIPVDGFYLNLPFKPSNLEMTSAQKKAYEFGKEIFRKYGNQRGVVAQENFLYDDEAGFEKTMAFTTEQREFYKSSAYDSNYVLYKIGVRFGKIPENGRSKNWGTGKLEKGVSIAYYLNNQTQNQKSWYDEWYGMQDIEKYLVGGWDTDTTGSDGEPILFNPVILGTFEEIKNIKNTDNRNPTESNDIRYSLNPREQLDAAIDASGAIPAGENPSRTVTTPVRTSADKKLSRTVRTIMEAEATPDMALPNIEQLAADEVFSYDPYSDKQAIADAENTIKRKGWAQSYADWTKNVEKGIVSKANTAAGWALYNNAVNSGDMSTAMDVITHMVEHQRSAAQALQATRILKQLSPEGQLYGVVKSVARLQEELNQKYRKQGAPELQVDEELAKRLLSETDETTRAEIYAEIYKDIGRQMPSNWLDKWNAWRYLAMLGNPRTHVRNIVGNAMFAPVVSAKNLTGAAIESMVHRLGKQPIGRTKAVLTNSRTDRALLKAAYDDYTNVKNIVSGGGKYSDFQNENQFIEDGRIIFKTKPLEAARRANSRAMEIEDVWFSRPRYAAALASYAKANGVNAERISNKDGLSEARKYAITEAQKATYRDTNAFSQAVGSWGKVGANATRVQKTVSTILSGILPFRKTPANILVRGIEYSPIGLMKSLTYDLYRASKGEISATQVIDNISAGVVGTGLVALGAFLAASGLIRGVGDDETKEFEELMGHQAYALELPNGTSMTLDWLAPEILPFFIGVNLWEASQAESEGITLSDIIETVTNITDPMLSMSVLQSLNDVFDSVGYAASNDTSALATIISSAATSYITQGLPTLGGQIERTTEAQRNTTYTEKNAFLPGDWQYTIGRASARIPGLDYQQIPYIDAWGRVEQTGSPLARSFNNFINPAYASTFSESDMERELLRLFEQTGESGVFPTSAPKYFTVNGERKDLTAEEYVIYAQEKGTRAYKYVTDLTKTSEYKAMDDMEKVDAISDAYNVANQEAKAEISAYEVTSWMQDAQEAEAKHGVSVGEFVALRASTSAIEPYKDKDGETITNSKPLQIMQEIYNTPGLSEAQRVALFEYMGVGSSVIHYNKAAVNEALKKMERQRG